MYNRIAQTSPRSFGLAAAGSFLASFLLAFCASLRMQFRPDVALIIGVLCIPGFGLCYWFVRKAVQASQRRDAGMRPGRVLADARAIRYLLPGSWLIISLLHLVFAKDLGFRILYGVSTLLFAGFLLYHISADVRGKRQKPVG